MELIKTPKFILILISLFTAIYGRHFEDFELFLEVPITVSSSGLSDHFENSWGGFGFNGVFVFDRYFGILGDIRVSDMGYAKQNFEYEGSWTTNHNVAMFSANINWTFFNFINNLIWFNPYIGIGIGTITTNGDKNDELDNYGLGATLMPTVGVNTLFKKINPLFFLFPGGLTFKMEVKNPLYKYRAEQFDGYVYQFNVGYGFGSCNKCTTERY